MLDTPSASPCLPLWGRWQPEGLTERKKTLSPAHRPPASPYGEGMRLRRKMHFFTSSHHETAGGDARIAPQQKLTFSENLRKIRNISQRADVGIGPYKKVFQNSEVTAKAATSFYYR